MNVALILSGGTGLRMGADIPKQYVIAGGKPIIAYSLERLYLHNRIDAIQIVADAAWRKQITEWITAREFKKKLQGFSSPGETRQLSIFNGLEDIRQYAEERDSILIHDAARPLLSDGQITDCLDGISGRDGVLPVLPMKDTVYLSKDGRSVNALLNRREVYAGQAPECFLLGKYYEANKRLLPEKIREINGSTEPAVIAGMNIAMIPGDEGNFKITTKADLERFCKIVEDR